MATETDTKYYDLMKGGYAKPPSIVILGNRALHNSIIIHSYLNYLFDYLSGDKLEIWEDQPLTNTRYIRLLRLYHGSNIKHFRPTKFFQEKKRFDVGLRKLYDEFVLRKSNRHSQMKKIVYIDTGLIMSDKPRAAMVEEILKHGGKKCNIQFIASAIAGTGEITGDLLAKFDIKIATLPLGKKDSIALFGADEYASKKEEDYVIFSYKDKVEKLPIFKYDTGSSTNEEYMNLIHSWTI